MVTKLMSFKFTPQDLALVEAIRKHALAPSNTEAIRIALRDYAAREGLLDGVRRVLSRKVRAATKRGAR